MIDHYLSTYLISFCYWFEHEKNHVIIFCLYDNSTYDRNSSISIKESRHIPLFAYVDIDP